MHAVCGGMDVVFNGMVEAYFESNFAYMLEILTKKMNDEFNYYKYRMHASMDLKIALF
jgi:hypothetical protein